MKKVSFNLLSCGLIALPLIVLGLWAVNGKWMYPAIFPSEYSLQKVVSASQEPNFWPAVLNSLFLASGATLLTLVIALPAAKFFAFQTYLSSKIVELIIYVPFILPAIALITSTQTVMIQLHLTGTFTGILLLHTYFMLPYALQILVESYLKMGTGYEQTARALGAGGGQTFFQVTFPLLRPGIATAAGLAFIVSFSQYLPTFFIGGGKIITLPLILLPYANNGRFGIAAVDSLVFLLACMLGVWGWKLLIGRNRYECNRK
ncbi:ABC transporter permease [Enterococcus sp. CSURQ0835]|uniref:ABC transporter permease n=1 Tax=Enterococcus sp. CSURQ0835 TaxID=2681394 RepID=UPI00135B76AB|nr:ABC transporter permease subunit [Enterococcus sp. CSURQ0835]